MSCPWSGCLQWRRTSVVGMVVCRAADSNPRPARSAASASRLVRSGAHQHLHPAMHVSGPPRPRPEAARRLLAALIEYVLGLLPIASILDAERPPLPRAPGEGLSLSAHLATLASLEAAGQRGMLVCGSNCGLAD